MTDTDPKAWALLHGELDPVEMDGDEYSITWKPHGGESYQSKTAWGETPEEAYDNLLIDIKEDMFACCVTPY